MICYDLPQDDGYDSPLSLISVIMYEKENLTASREEERAAELLRWLNERGCLYHVEAWSGDNYNLMVTTPAPKGMKLEYRTWKIARVVVYDDETNTLLKMFFDDIKSYPFDPDELPSSEPEPSPVEVHKATWWERLLQTLMGKASRASRVKD